MKVMKYRRKDDVLSLQPLHLRAALLRLRLRLRLFLLNLHQPKYDR